MFNKEGDLSNIIERDSPVRNILKSEDFNENSIVVTNKKTGAKKGESGLEIEYLISISKLFK